MLFEGDASPLVLKIVKIQLYLIHHQDHLTHIAMTFLHFVRDVFLQDRFLLEKPEQPPLDSLFLKHSHCKGILSFHHWIVGCYSTYTAQEEHRQFELFRLVQLFQSFAPTHDS